MAPIQPDPYAGAVLGTALAGVSTAFPVLGAALTAIGLGKTGLKVAQGQELDTSDYANIGAPVGGAALGLMLKRAIPALAALKKTNPQAAVKAEQELARAALQGKAGLRAESVAPRAGTARQPLERAGVSQTRFDPGTRTRADGVTLPGRPADMTFQGQMVNPPTIPSRGAPTMQSAAPPDMTFQGQMVNPPTIPSAAPLDMTRYGPLANPPTASSARQFEMPTSFPERPFEVPTVINRTAPTIRSATSPDRLIDPPTIPSVRKPAERGTTKNAPYVSDKTRVGVVEQPVESVNVPSLPPRQRVGPAPTGVTSGQQDLAILAPLATLGGAGLAAYAADQLGAPKREMGPALNFAPQNMTPAAEKPEEVMFPAASVPSDSPQSKPTAKPEQALQQSTPSGGYTVKPGDQLGDIAYAFLQSSTGKKPTKDQVHTQIGKFIQELGLKESQYGKDLPVGAVLRGVSSSLAAPRGGMVKAFGKAKKPKTPVQAQAAVAPAFKTVPGELGKLGKFAQEDAEAKILFEKETPKLGQEKLTFGSRRPVVFTKSRPTGRIGQGSSRDPNQVRQDFLQAIENKRVRDAKNQLMRQAGISSPAQGSLPSMEGVARPAPVLPGAVARPIPKVPLQGPGLNPSVATARNVEEWAQRQMKLKKAMQHNPELDRRPALVGAETVNLQHGGAAWGSFSGAFSKGLPMGARIGLRDLPNVSEVGVKGLAKAAAELHRRGELSTKLAPKESKEIWGPNTYTPRLMLGKEVHPSVPRHLTKR